MTIPTLNPPTPADLPQPTAAPPLATTPAPPAPARRPRRRWWIVAAAAGLAVVLALVGWIVWRNWVPSAPGTPAATAITATSVELRWAASAEGPSVDAYFVQRDGVQVGSVAGSVTTYVDQGIAPDSSHRYAVVAGSGSKRSIASTEMVVRTLPAAPTALQAIDRTRTSVTLQWTPPAVGRAPDGYVVLRDGSEVARVAGTTQTYRDTGLVPVTTYTYTVVTIKGDLQSAESTALDATTLPPPVTSALLSGPWVVDGKIVKATTGIMLDDAPALGQTFSSTWTFSPKGTGTPSPVSVSGEYGGEYFTVTLRPSGGTYTGSTKAHIGHCVTPAGSRDIKDTVRLTLTVKAAEVASTTWSATSWTGTLRIDNPYTAVGNSGWYCPAGTIIANLTASPLSTGS